MDDELKTVGVASEDTSLSTVDPLLKAQQNNVSLMRETLLSFNKADLSEAKRAMQNITVLRVYHLVGRIIKCTEMLDLLEDKMYDSMIANIGQMDSCDPMTLMTLLKVQAQLQENMLLSQQLIKPYLDLDIAAIAPPVDYTETSFGATIISQESRNNIRSGAQALLTELRKANPELPTDGEAGEQTEPEKAVVNGDSNVGSANKK